jgi:acyl-CoA thioesterase
MPDMHAFDHAIALEVVDDDVVRGTTRPEWVNMVGPFGGVTAAILLRAIQVHPDCLGEPVALTVNFAAPIADGDFEISRRAPRTNRTNQHWIVELSQDGAVKTTATAIFGIRRDTWSDTQAVPPAAPPPEQISRSSRENCRSGLICTTCALPKARSPVGQCRQARPRRPRYGYATPRSARSTFRH